MTSPEHPPINAEPTTTSAAPPAGSDTRASIELGYETRDVNFRAILMLALGTLAGAAIVHVSLWFLLLRYQTIATTNDPQLSPLATERVVPPSPRLQNTPNLDYDDYRDAQQELLSNYGWADENQQVVRIPVARAIDLLLTRGLPEPAAQEADQDVEPAVNQEQ